MSVWAWPWRFIHRAHTGLQAAGVSDALESHVQHSQLGWGERQVVGVNPGEGIERVGETFSSKTWACQHSALSAK